MKDKKNILKVILIVLLTGLLLVSIFFIVDEWEKTQYNSGESDYMLNDVITVDGKEYELKENVETFLILGVDKFKSKDTKSYNNDKQADFLTLVVIDNDKKTCLPIHINRDSMVEMNVLGVAGDVIDTDTKQIALAHTYGNGKKVSCRNTAEAVSNLLMNVTVDHYLSVTMDAVSVYNDFVGGVEVEILDDFTSVDKSMKLGENVLLKGEQALAYVRTRYGLEDSTNNNRMIRQQQYIKALIEKSEKLAKEDDEFIANAFVKTNEYLVSDCSISKLEKLFEKMSTYKIDDFVSLEGETRKGKEYMEFYPDDDFIRKLVLENFYVEK